MLNGYVSRYDCVLSERGRVQGTKNETSCHCLLASRAFTRDFVFSFGHGG
jgi:hypothetical protein